MNANIAGIYGTQTFRGDDKPLYRRAFTISIGILALGLVLAIPRYIDDRIRRRRAVSNDQIDAIADADNASLPPFPESEEKDLSKEIGIFEEQEGSDGDGIFPQESEGSSDKQTTSDEEALRLGIPHRKFADDRYKARMAGFAHIFRRKVSRNGR